MAQKECPEERMEDFNMMKGMDGIMLPGKNGKRMPFFGFYSDFDDVLRNDCLEEIWDYLIVVKVYFC